MFAILASVARQLIHIQKKFFWSGGEDRKLATISWASIEPPKELGGLAVGSIRMKNLGLLLKWWWRFCTEDESLWRRVIASIHNISSQSMNLEVLQQIKSGPLHEISVASSKIPWFKEILLNSFKLQLGKGNIICFWEDHWLNQGILRDIYPRLYQLTAQRNHTISDVGFWDGVTWIWDLQWRRYLFDWEKTWVNELVELLSSIIPSKEDSDRMIWLPDKSKGYSVHSFMQEASKKVYTR